MISKNGIGRFTWGFVIGIAIVIFFVIMGLFYNGGDTLHVNDDAASCSYSVMC